MNGRDLFISLGYIDQKFVEEAENGAFQPKVRSFKRPLLIAAVVGLSLLLVGCGIAYAQGWFLSYFAEQSKAPLSEKQVSYITENEQVITDTATQNGWTVELRSAINDGTKAYIILGVTAPEGIPLENSRFDENMTLYLLCAGNHGMLSGLHEGTPLLAAEGFTWRSLGWSWNDDGDGLANTANFVLDVQPNLDQSRENPFAPDVEYKIHIEDFVEEYQDPEYLQELRDGKYKDQPRFALTPEEAKRARQVNVLGEGSWDFTIRFSESKPGVELLTEPISVMAYQYKESPDPLWITKYTYGPTTLSSFILRPLGATITFDPQLSLHLAQFNEGERVYAVMKDGSQVELRDMGSPDTAILYLDVVSPIVVEDVDHVLLPDGTKLPVPDITP